MLKTKSVQKKKAKTDGIRICIMRRVKPHFEYDIWMPTLSPSTELLKDYHEQKVDWEKYEKLFAKEVFEANKEFVEIVGEMAENHDVTLLCWEETPHLCHRRLVAEEVLRKFPKTKVKIA